MARATHLEASCRICKSPFREEIEMALKNHVSKRSISWQYSDHFECKPDNVYDSICSHIKNNHPKILTSNPTQVVTMTDDTLPSAINPDGSPMTIESYAQKLLELGFKPEMLNNVRHIDIYRAQKLLIEKQKAKNEESALKLGMAKFMAGMIGFGDATEIGKVLKVEEVEGTEQPSPLMQTPPVKVEEPKEVKVIETEEDFRSVEL